MSEAIRRRYLKHSGDDFSLKMNCYWAFLPGPGNNISTFWGVSVKTPQLVFNSKNLLTRYLRMINDRFSGDICYVSMIGDDIRISADNFWR